MTTLTEQAQQALTTQPFSVFIGAHIAHFAQGVVELHIPIRPELLQQHGFVHGGVLSYAADNALTFVGSSALGQHVVTSEFKINYLRPAQGTLLIARATLLHGGKTQAVCRCDIFCVTQDGERLCAAAQGTIAKLPAKNP